MAGMAGLEPATCWVVEPGSENKIPARPSSLPLCRWRYIPILAGKAHNPAVAGLSRPSSICPAHRWLLTGAASTGVPSPPLDASRAGVVGRLGCEPIQRSTGGIGGDAACRPKE